jgi:hypothetical protein
MQNIDYQLVIKLALLANMYWELKYIFKKIKAIWPIIDFT